MPTCELLTIGSELLNGSVLNTNAQFLAKRISGLNFTVAWQTSCRDREDDLLKALRSAFERADLVIATGGLGPTPDDVTRQTVAKFFRCGLKFDPAQYRLIVNHFRKLHRTTPLMTRQEAFLPDRAKPLLNRYGIALGFYIIQNRKMLVFLPGVPSELMKMYESRVHPLIRKTFRDRHKTFTLEAQIVSLYETQVMRKLGSKFFKGRDFEFGIYPEIGEVTIRIKARHRNLISILKRELIKKLGGSLYTFRSKPLSFVIGEKLSQRRKTLAIAESCTGGLVAKLATDPPGASHYFKGAVVAYSNDVKSSRLKIPPDHIKRFGAVSKPIALEMAKAVRNEYQTSIGLSVTGIAGPSGGSRKKPVGLVYFGISDRKKARAYQFHFVGERWKIRAQAAQKALFLLWQWLRER